MTIGGLAAATAVTVETIRYYQRRGLIREPSRTFRRVRRYDSTDVARVRFVRRAQGIGFSLSEIAALLRLEDGSHCVEARQVALSKLSGIRMRLSELQRMEKALSALAAACENRSGPLRCPLIEALQVDDQSATHPSGRTRSGN